MSRHDPQPPRGVSARGAGSSAAGRDINTNFTYNDGVRHDIAVTFDSFKRLIQDNATLVDRTHSLEIALEDAHQQLSVAEEDLDSAVDEVRRLKARPVVATRRYLRDLALATVVGLFLALTVSTVLLHQSGGTPPGGPGTVVAATGQPSVSAQPVAGAAMPCEPGTVIVRLASIAGDQAEILTNAKVRELRSRASRYAPEYAADDVQPSATAVEDACAAVVPDLDTGYVVWAGPFSSTTDGVSYCRAMGLSLKFNWDCYPRTVS